MNDNFSENQDFMNDNIDIRKFRKMIHNFIKEDIGKFREKIQPDRTFYKALNDNPSSSQIYLGKVREAIQNRLICPKEAILAGATSNTRFNEKLRISLPFASHRYYKLDTDNIYGTNNKLIKQRYYIIEDKYGNMTEEEQDEISKKPFDKKLYCISDALAGLKVSRFRKEFFNCVPFHLLDWSNDGSWFTPVDKIRLRASLPECFGGSTADKINFSSNDKGRVKTWQEIHRTIEDIAAGIMQEKGWNL